MDYISAFSNRRFSFWLYCYHAQQALLKHVIAMNCRNIDIEYCRIQCDKALSNLIGFASKNDE